MDTRAAFALLGLPPTASPDAVKDAYRDLVKVWHPDRFPGDSRLQAKANGRLRELNDAYKLAMAHAATFDRIRRPAGQAVGAPPPASAPAGTAPAVDAAAVRRRWLRLSPSMVGTALFWAAVCGVIAFVLNAPEGFFGRSTGRALGRQPRYGVAEARVYTRLPESEYGEAQLVARLRGTWVVVETEGEAWLPSGTHVDLRGSSLACHGPKPCEAALRPIGASRLAIRGAAAGDHRDVDVAFASATSMQWVARAPQGARTARLLLEAQGAPLTPAAVGP